MNLEGRKSWTIFLGIITFILLVGVLTGFPSGENSVCLNCHQDLKIHFYSTERTNPYHSDKEFVKQVAPSHRFVREKIHASASFSEEESGEKIDGWAKAISIFLISTFIGGMVFLFVCL